jgi:hypothetical protein
MAAKAEKKGQRKVQARKKQSLKGKLKTLIGLLLAKALV